MPGAVPDIEYAQDPYAAIEGSEALLMCTEWGEFNDLDLDKIKSLMAFPIIFDGRNIFDPEEVRGKDIKYFGIGR